MYALLTGHLRHEEEPDFEMLMTGINGVQFDRVRRFRHCTDLHSACWT